MLGTVHVAFGASAGIGGTVAVPVHLDCLVGDATLDVGGTRVLERGRFVLERVTRLVAVPNVSEGRDDGGARRASAPPSRAHAAVLHRSEDPDHHRAVFVLAGEPGRAAPGARGRGARGRRADRPAPPRRAAPARRRARRRARRLPRRRGARRRDRGGAARGRRDRRGRHPRLPLRRARRRAHPRGAAPRRARRASPARGTPPDYGPRSCIRPRAATLVAARPPLIAFNLELAPPATLDDAARSPPDPRGRGRGAARRARARAAPRAPGRRPGLDQHRGPPGGPRADVLARRARHHAGPARRARGARAGGRARRLAARRRAAHAGAASRPCSAARSEAHGPDQAQAPLQAPRERRRHRRGARPHRPQADAGGAQEGRRRATGATSGASRADVAGRRAARRASPR